MRINARWGSLAGMAASLALVAGCSGGGSQMPQSTTPMSAGSTTHTMSQRAAQTYSIFASAKQPPPAQQKHLGSWFSSNHPTTNTVFISDVLNNVVDIFDLSTQHQIGQIGPLNTPQGLSTDRQGFLYETDTTTQDIQIFAPPYNGTPKVLEEPGTFPVGVYADGSGNVWVANICSGVNNACNSNAGGSIVEFINGTQTHRTLHGGPARDFFVTVNKNGDVWADGQDINGLPIIGFWAGGTGSFTAVPLPLNFPGGLMFDNKGNLLMDDQLGDPTNFGSIIKIFPPGQTTPSGTITLQTTGDDVVDPALGTAFARIFSPQFLGGFGAIITYPQGNMKAQTLTPKQFGFFQSAAALPAPEL